MSKNSAHSEERDLTFQIIKAGLVKKCILDFIAKYIKINQTPINLFGVILNLESEIISADISFYADEELLIWIEQHIRNMRQKEMLYPQWDKHTPTHKKLSSGLDRLKLRISPLLGARPEIVNQEAHEMEAIIIEARRDLKNKLDKEAVVQAVVTAMNAYKNSSFWPISTSRGEQQRELLLQIHQAQSAKEALKILHQGMMQIEQHHISTSIAANLPFYQRESRLVRHLRQASITLINDIGHEVYPKKTFLEKNVEQVVQMYLASDIFYHNRKRRIVACQLLEQLRADNLQFSEGEKLQKKYKMRSTLDYYIQKIDEDFKNTHIFSRFYKTKRSRLAMSLDIVKEGLIRENLLPAFELEKDIKQPIMIVIDNIMQDSKQKLDAELQKGMYSLFNTIKEAQTPHAIEAILEGHIRSYLKCASETDFITTLKNLISCEHNPYLAIALQMESALLTWQEQGILPAASGYKTFLQTLASDRQTHENELQILERIYRIKIPRCPKDMQTQNTKIQQAAKNLLNRI